MNRMTLAVTSAALLLLLAGCTAGADAEQAASGSTPSASAPADAAAPLVAETPESSAGTAQRDAAAFVAKVRSTLRAENVIPNATDEQLIAAGLKACELRASGMDVEDITVIDGEQRTYGTYLDSVKIYDAAREDLC